jgi:two-component system, LytTR family, response regulator
MLAEKPLNILIIDDSVKSGARLISMFRIFFSNIKILGQTDSLCEGMELAEVLHPDLLIINYALTGMPTKHGHRNATVLKSIPVIFLSTDYKQAINAIKYSPVAYLLTPVVLSDLEQAINKVRKLKHQII